MNKKWFTGLSLFSMYIFDHICKGNLCEYKNKGGISAENAGIGLDQASASCLLSAGEKADLAR